MSLFLSVLLTLVPLGAGFVICYKMAFRHASGSAAEKISWRLLTLLTLVAVAGYFRFGTMHDYGQLGRHSYQYHDYYHYFFGAKYLKEVGYFGLYDFTALAFSDLREEGIAVPKIEDVRTLRSCWKTVPYNAVVEETRKAVERRFSNDRWREFKKDLRNYLALGWHDSYWQTILYDAGFNPPPTWAVLGSPLANLFSVSRRSVESLPFVDYFLVFCVTTAVIGRCFGAYPALLYLLVFSVSWFNSMTWTGGSFFRLPELAMMAIGICMLQKKHHIAAGICLGVATGMRIFPVFFVLGGGVALFAQRKRKGQSLKPFLEFGISATATIAVLAGLSLLLFGPALWQEFYAKMATHHNILFVNQIGFKKLAVFSHAMGNQDFWWSAGLSRMEAWQARLMSSYNDHRVLFAGIQAAFIFLSVLAARKLSAPVAAMLIGGTLLFFLEIPSNYYYAFLAVFPAVFYSLEERNGYDIFRMAAVFGLITALPLAVFKTADPILYNGYMNWLVFAFYLVVIASYLLQQRRTA